MTDCKRYSPDIQAQGDCRNCGHSYDAHHITRPPKPTPTRPQTTALATARDGVLEEAAAEFLKRGTPIDIWAAKKIRALKGVH